MIYVTAELKIRPEQELTNAYQAIEQFCRDMESEEGCLQATATFDVNEPRRVLLWERYVDQAAIEAHFVMPHTQAFIANNIAELVQAFNTQAGEQLR